MMHAPSHSPENLAIDGRIVYDAASVISGAIAGFTAARGIDLGNLALGLNAVPAFGRAYLSFGLPTRSSAFFESHDPDYAERRARAFTPSGFHSDSGLDRLIGALASGAIGAALTASGYALGYGIGTLTR